MAFINEAPHAKFDTISFFLQPSYDQVWIEQHP
jgi:hypothetical protein